MTVSITPSTLGPFSKITAIHFPNNKIPPGYPPIVYVVLLGNDALGTVQFQPPGSSHTFNFPYGSPCLDFGLGGLLPPPVLTPLVTGHTNSPPGYFSRIGTPFGALLPMSLIMTWTETDPSGPGQIKYAGGLYLDKLTATTAAANIGNTPPGCTVQDYVWK